MLLSELDAELECAFATGRFFVGPECALRTQLAVDEEVLWEVFLGHLLEPSLTRRLVRFRAWHLYLDTAGRSAEMPLVSLRYDAAGDVLHVCRNILTHGHQAYEASPGVIETRPVQKWVPERVGALEQASVKPGRLQAAADQLLLLALIGTSRLPITSQESPLPAYSLGQIGYLPGAVERSEPYQDAGEFFLAASRAPRPLLETAKALETLLRTQQQRTPAELAELLNRATGDDATHAAALLGEVFNTVALAPYTSLPERLVAVVEQLATCDWFGSTRALDTLSYMLRHLGRHLTAFDLSLFHNFGANYPDALFLDALLKAYVRLLERDAVAARSESGRMFRRALRQGCLLRRHYEGLRVPDAPTSAGENARVLPEPFIRVPEEQIYEPSKRRRVLFADEATERLLSPTVRRLLEMSLLDLESSTELRELGMASFLDRPLGIAKPAGAIDQTPLLAHEAFSRFVANRRLAALKSAGWLTAQQHETLREVLKQLDTPGLPVAELAAVERPGVVSLADMAKVATDFVIVRSTRGSVSDLLREFDWEPLAARFPQLVVWLRQDRHVILVHQQPIGAEPRPAICAYAGDSLRLELLLEAGADIYRQEAAREVPRRLRVAQAWNETQQALVEPHEELWIHARSRFD